MKISSSILKPKAMKTVKVLFAAFALSVAFASCQKDNIEPQISSSDQDVIKSIPSKPGDNNNRSLPEKTFNVRYEVNVNIATDKDLCNVYQVEILDGTGQQVAPAIIYVPGTSVYNFYEQTRRESGIRIARLVQVPWDKHYACETELFTKPVARVLNFEDGATYTFDLYPSAHPSKNSD
jgi:hypothetical protein